MIEIREVLTKKQQREFLNFPLMLYRGNSCFVPPLYGDEKKMFRRDYVYYDTCEAVYYNAYRDGKMVGRISGILQNASNEKTGEKRVRFTRFDSIDDVEVASALFSSVEAWAKQKGMNTVCGPLGFSDLEREGLLIDGFDELSTFEEQYNYAYYSKLIEACGYQKEVDWLERKIYRPKNPDPKMRELSDFLLKRNRLHFGTAKNTADFLRKYSSQMFDLLDLTYHDLYGTVPFTDGMKKMLVGNFRLMIDLKHVAVILDENDKLVCFGICFPSIARAVQPSGGHLTPFCILRLLKAIRHPQIIDMGLVGVIPEYANRGISTAILSRVMDMLGENGVAYAETNLNLEDNYNIQNQWKRFDSVQHKRRRSYWKKLEA